ncbi:SIMPL domain-containing protein [Pedobacter sp. SD-b]|uniref:SIMPL domain-containing protein n=1 Tax=Pedobacter segetis TaxID=2793069 RepID=A0ABS1BGF9_9SPHI|nr:SIMPL domain-containing protein [Pedobacter segetis]MBK0381950.1 SIMPL domain-containing protein [Pedobacter segetis]
MKRIFLSALIAFTTIGAFAQNNLDTRKKITVTGNAETEVTPDIIYVGISLKEYLKDSKRKVTIDDLENQLQKAVIAAGIPNQDFMINNVSAYNNYWEKKKDPTFLASKQYSIKVSDLNKLNQIIAAIDPKGIAYTNVEKYEYSKAEELKKELKIKALKQARDKAVYLTESIGDKIYQVLEIQESGSENYPQPIYRTQMMMKSADANEAMPDIDFKKIKLTAQINAVFEIK